MGADTAAEVRRARRELCNVSGAKALTLELPLSHAGTPHVCRAVEEDGFFFSGVGPAFATEGDALLLQFLGEEIDPCRVQVEHPFGQDLVAYVVRERDRVTQLSPLRLEG